VRSYQVIILIGSIVGILVSIGLSFTMGFLSQMTNDPSPFQGHMRIHGAAALSFVLFIAVLVVTFAVKQTKIVGIISIIISVITLIVLWGFGIVSFALLLAGGIVSLAYKDKPQPKYNPDTGELIR
jgi:hypothetical protein